jgi:hypothetical protein
MRKRVCKALGQGLVPIIALAAANDCTPEYETLPQVQGPDGRRWWELACENRKACWETLGENCPHGYITRDEVTQIKGATAAYFGRISTVSERSETSLLFRCKDEREQSEQDAQ